jgi:hypothetical protein
VIFHRRNPALTLEPPLIEELPAPEKVRDRLGDALREVELLRSLLRLSERAQHYRDCDRQPEKGGPAHGS